MHWLVNDTAAVSASEKVAFTIMHDKLKLQARAFKLTGKDPRLALWISDIRHQGRGGPRKINAALAEPTLKKQLRALSKVDVYNSKHPNGRYVARRKAVRKSIDVLVSENRFDNVLLGDARLPL